MNWSIICRRSLERRLQRPLLAKSRTLPSIPQSPIVGRVHQNSQLAGGSEPCSQLASCPTHLSACTLPPAGTTWSLHIFISLLHKTSLCLSHLAPNTEGILRLVYMQAFMASRGLIHWFIGSSFLFGGIWPELLDSKCRQLDGYGNVHGMWTFSEQLMGKIQLQFRKLLEKGLHLDRISIGDLPQKWNKEKSVVVSGWYIE